jgi:hypothetical protein
MVRFQHIAELRAYSKEVCMLKTVIIIIAFFGFLEANAQQGPMCQPMPTVAGPKLPRVPGQPPTADCAQWRCMQPGKCQTTRWRKVEITTCPPACTPNQKEYTNELEYVWTEGCSKWACVAAKLPECPPGYIRKGANCVATNQQFPSNR